MHVKRLHDTEWPCPLCLRVVGGATWCRRLCRQLTVNEMACRLRICLGEETPAADTRQPAAVARAQD